MKWTTCALVLFLCLSALCWGQASESDSADTPPPALEQSETNSSLLWNSGAAALNNSILSFEALGTRLQLIESWTKKSLELSEKAWQLSMQLEQTTSAAYNNYISLETSSTSLENASIQITKHLTNLQIELWLWRIATVAATAGVIYFIITP